MEKIKEEPEKENEEESGGRKSATRELKKSKSNKTSNNSNKKGNSEKKSVFSLRFGRYTEAEQIAAGWPPWLTAVAGEAVDGWMPMRADLFEKLDKVVNALITISYLECVSMILEKICSPDIMVP